MAFCSLRSPILANHFLPVNWALCANDNSSNGVDLKKLITFIVCVLFLTGCTAEFKDNSSEYSQILNKEFETLGEMNIYSYTLKVEQNKKIDGYSLHEPPGISGPEIIRKFWLPVGSKFTIYKVEKCSNCLPFSSYSRFLIKLKNNSKFKSVPMHFGKYIYSQKGVLWQ